jgi:hypothetical protein
MMASTISALLCGLTALVLWSGTGFVVARRLPIERSLVLPVAPIVGWAVQNAIVLPIAMIAGLSPLIIVGASGAICALVAVSTSSMGPSEGGLSKDGAAVPWLAFGVAAVVALAPAAAILPKVSGDAVFLSAPMFDHSKIALIGEIVRDGVPPGNPVFATGGGAGSLAYYYLWHFAAAQLSRLTGASGWEADIASTWFTAFATLALMSGFAVHFGKRRMAAFIVPLLACCGSIRPVLIWLFRNEPLSAYLQPATGLGGWLFQVAWSPHHVAAAACVVVAVLVMARLAERPSGYAAAVLACLIAAAFGSSIWVGGVTLAIAGVAVALAQVVRAAPGRRIVLLACWSSAALTALALAWPILSQELHAATARGTGIPMAVEPYRVLGPGFGELQRFLDLPAYWFVLLPVEFPVLIVAGIAGAVALQATSKGPRPIELGLLVAASLICTWLLVSTVGHNNDLGWRAVLPAVLVVTAVAAAGIAHWIARSSKAPIAVALIAVLLGFPDGALLIAGYVKGDATPDGFAFAKDSEMWEAVRKYANKNDRIANNPLHVSTLTPWPINSSWALLANRRSCFAHSDLAIALVSLRPEERADIAARFARVFDGLGSEEDVTILDRDYGCRVVVLTPADAAWTHDPFAQTPRYRQVEAMPLRWRIYVSTNANGDVPLGGA